MATRTVYTSTALEVLTSANFEKMPKGWIGYAQITANQTGIGTSYTDVTNLTVTPVVPASRLLKISANVNLLTASAAFAAVALLEDGTIINEVPVYCDSSGASTAPLALVAGPSAGSHTYKVQAKAFSGTVDVTATATVKCTLLVEDIGPSS